MRRLWNPLAAIITFFIGVACTAVWLIGGQIFQKAEAPNVPPVYLSAQNQSDPEVEKYAVYSALIKDMYVDGHAKLLVIVDGNHYPGLLEGATFDEIPETKREAFNDFRAKAKDSLSLNKSFDIPIGYVIVSDKEIDSLFSKYGISGWDRFYAKYPHSSGIIGFSNVGFNSEMSQAVVYTSRGCGGLCGEGNIVILKKEQGVWKVESKEMLWVS
jgi:hypothetical protein